MEEAREEAGRFDHGEIEDGNREYIDQVKVVRKRHRKNKEVEDLQADSDVDDDFKTGLLDAANRFGQKRKKKHMFTETGVPIEPFHIKNDIRDGLLTEQGFLKKSLQDYDKLDNTERDAWLDSI